MDRDTAVSLIKSRLQRANDTAIDTQIVLEMQAIQQELELAPKLPWFLLSEFLSRNTEVGEERVPLPAAGGNIEGDFLRESEQGSLWILNAAADDYDPLTKDSFEALEALYGSLAQGKPKGYALEGKYFRLKPVPDAVYTLRMRVYLRDATLDTNVENDWLKWAADLMMAKTAQKIAQYHLRDLPMAQAFTQDIVDAMNRLNIFDEARMHVNQDYQMGGPD